MTYKVRICQACGGSAIKIKQKEHKVYIQCNVCGMRTNTYESVEETIAVWDENIEPEYICVGMDCEYCAPDNQALANPTSHDFRIIDDGLFFYDSTLGWEGIRANYCFECGRKLKEE